MINSLIMQGRMVWDPKHGKKDGGNAWAIFRLASNRGFGDRAKTTFIDVFAYGRTAEQVAKLCQKGTMVAAVGRLEIEEKEVQGSDRKERNPKLMADQVEIISGMKPRTEDGEGGSGGVGEASGQDHGNQGTPPDDEFR